MILWWTNPVQRRRRRWPEPGTTAITGAASGIGRALAVRLSCAGHNLGLADRNAEGLAETAARCERLGAAVHQEVFDVADRDAMACYAVHTSERFGSVDAICNIAGVIHAGTVEQASLEDLDLIMRTNFGGVVHGTTSFLPLVMASGGAIVNVSSAYGLISGPAYGAYNASKFAVRAWTDALRMEMLAAGRNVRVITVFPGGTRTPIMASSTSAAGSADAEARRQFFDTRIARTAPESVAEHIVTAMVRGKRRALVGPDAVLADVLARVSGTAYEHLLARTHLT